MWNLVSQRKFLHKQSLVFTTHFLICLAFFVSIFWDGNCSPSCSSEINDKGEQQHQLPLPQLNLWSINETVAILEEPGDKIVELVATQTTVTSEVGIHGVAITCSAPYPVLLVALMAGDNDNEEEFKMSSMTNFLLEEFYVYPFSEPWSPDTLDQISVNPSFNRIDDFEIRSLLTLSRERNVSVFACEAVHNPCLGAAGKLVFTNLGESRVPGPRSLFDFTAKMTENLQPHSHPFLTSGDNSLPKIKTKSDSSANSSLNGTKMESDCDAIFYYQTVATRSLTLDETKFELVYSCEFKGGSPGIVKIHRCTNRGRCVFPQLQKKTVQNCWRRFSAGRTRRNCTRMTTHLYLMEPFVPVCVSSEGVSTAKSVELFSSSTAPLKGNQVLQTFYKNFIKRKDMVDGIRVVKGTPLYVGFPSGLNISSPDIQTWEEDDGGNERMIRMHVFEEVQLVNSSLEITCDSSPYYTAKAFLFALKFHNKSELVILAASNETAGPRRVKIQVGEFYTQTINYHLNEQDLEVERIICLAPVQNSRNWVNASRPLRVVPQVQDLFKPSSSSCQFPTLNPSLPFKTHPKLVIKYTQYKNQELIITSENETEHGFYDEENYIECESNYPIELIHTSVSDDARKYQHGGYKYSWQYQIPNEMKNPVRYSFSTRGFDLRAANVSQFFRCQSIENTCLHRSFQFFRLPRSAQSPFDNQNFMVRSFSPGDPREPDTVETELGRPPKYEKCEVLFFYKETPDKRGYEFRCEFALEQRGIVNFHYCDSMNGCANTLRNRRQSPKCWRKVESWGNCGSKCETKKTDGFRPFVATCSFDRHMYEVKWTHEDGPRYQESTLGNFADDPGILLPESEKLETLDLLNFSFGIASGMNFLAEKKVIHGDLAARNVLLTQSREVKISDFGFSTQLKSYENYKETNPLSIPWRWFPIEALVNRKFSLKSDCWSYGILLHEIFSLGEDPYPELDRLDLSFIRDGYRMEMPEFANDDIYNLMTECWQKDPHERPTFAEVCEKILNLSSEIVGPKLNLI